MFRETAACVPRAGPKEAESSGDRGGRVRRAGLVRSHVDLLGLLMLVTDLVTIRVGIGYQPRIPFSRRASRSELSRRRRCLEVSGSDAGAAPGGRAPSWRARSP